MAGPTEMGRKSLVLVTSPVDLGSPVVIPRFSKPGMSRDLRQRFRMRRVTVCARFGILTVSRMGLESGTRRRACAVPSVYFRSSRIFWKLALNLRSMRSLRSSPGVRGVCTVQLEVSTALSSAGEMPSYPAEELESRVPTMRSIVGRSIARIMEARFGLCLFLLLAQARELGSSLHFSSSGAGCFPI